MNSSPHPTRFELTTVGSRQLPVQELFSAVWDLLRDELDERLHSGASDQVTCDFIMGAAEDFLEAAGSDAVEFASRALGGCAMAAPTTDHWMGMMFAVLGTKVTALLAEAGYALREPLPTTASLLASGPLYPLVEIRGEYYCVNARSADDFDVFTDEMPDAVSVDDLTSTERELVAEVARTGRCRCEICEGLREEIGERTLGAPAPVFNPNAKRALVFTLDELSPRFPSARGYGVSERIRSHVYYLTDRSLRDTYTVPDEPLYPDEENARGYEYLTALGEVFAELERFPYVCDPSSGAFLWQSAWHNSASKDELVECFQRQGFEVVSLSYLVDAATATQAPEVFATDVAHRDVAESLLVAVGFVQTEWGRWSCFELPDTVVSLIAYPELGWLSVRCNGGDQRKVADWLREKVPAVKEVLGRLRDEPGIAPLERVRLAVTLGNVSNPLPYWEVIEAELRRSGASPGRELLAALSDYLHPKNRNLLLAPEVQSRLLKLSSDPELAALRSELSALHRLCVRGRPTRCQDVERAVRRDLEYALKDEPAREVPSDPSRVAELLQAKDAHPASRAELVARAAFCGWSYELPSSRSQATETDERFRMRQETLLAVPELFDGARGPFECPQLRDEEPNWAWAGEENCLYRLAWRLRMGDAAGALFEQSRLFTMPATKFTPGALTIELMTLADEVQSREPSVRAWLASPAFRLHCATLFSARSVDVHQLSAWLVALSALEGLRQQSVRELVTGSLRELDDLVFGSDSAPRFSERVEGKWWLVEEQLGRKKARHLELRAAMGDSGCSALGLLAVLEALPTGVGALGYPDHRVSFAHSAHTTEPLSFAQKLHGEFDRSATKRLLGDVRKKPDSELRIVLSGGPRIEGAECDALLRRVAVMTRFMRHHEALSKREPAGFVGPIVVVCERGTEREELARWVTGT